MSRALIFGTWYGGFDVLLHGEVGAVIDEVGAAMPAGPFAGELDTQSDEWDHEPPEEADEPETSGRHSERPAGGGKGAWLAQLGLTPGDLAGKIITVAQYKGGVGKTFFALELAYLLGAVLVDLDWDRGNASRALGYREEARKTAPLLDALERGKTPRPIAGGPWKADLVPCSAAFEEQHPPQDELIEAIERWAEEWGRELGCPVVLDTHPGAGPVTYAAVSAAHAVLAPVVLAERPMEATTGFLDELKSYNIVLIPNMVTGSPPQRYIDWLRKIAAQAFIPVGPSVSAYPWLQHRKRRMAICASNPPPAKSERLVTELQRVAERMLQSVTTTA